jgi:hypothetical protein
MHVVGPVSGDDVLRHGSRNPSVYVDWILPPQVGAPQFPSKTTYHKLNIFEVVLGLKQLILYMDTEN